MTSAIVNMDHLAETEQAVVFVIEDDPDLRQIVAMLVQSIDLPARTFASAREFLAVYDDRQLGCIVLDLKMPGMTGVELQQQLAARGSTIPLIFVSGDSEVATVAAAMRAGAVDFIPKPFCGEHLLERIREALDLARRRRAVLAQRKDVEGRVAALTLRQREVMQLLAQGESTKLIARRLGISQKTVDNHRAKVLEKMSADNAAQLAASVSHLEMPSETNGAAKAHHIEAMRSPDRATSNRL
jgi:FixJ family two-component response regulator